MSKQKSKGQKAVERAFFDTFKVQAAGVQFSVLDLDNLKSDTFASIALGKTMEEALAEAIAKYRKN
jgi:hypothetical protein